MTQDNKRENIKAKIHRFVEDKVEETGKTKMEVLKTIRKGQRMRIPGVKK